MNTINSFWYSRDKNTNTISDIEVLCITSYLANNHPFHLYTYDIDDASMQYLIKRLESHKNFSNFSIKDANTIVPREKIFFDDRGVGIAAFSDYIRYHILYQMGGWWVDTDTICVRPLDSLTSEFVFASERVKNKDDKEIPTTCVIKAPKNSPILTELIREAERAITDKSNQSKIKLKNILKFDFSRKVRWGIIGPVFLGNFIVAHKLENFVVSAKFFCDVNWWDFRDFITPRKFVPDTHIYIYHVWNAKWFDLQLDKNATYPDSILEYFKTKYLV